MKRAPLNIELVRMFIVAAHGNLEEVKRLVIEEPALVNSTINWSADDWESGLGAAAHTGSRDIAELLLEKGARMDIFTAAMLGELNIVQAMLERYPSMIHAQGAHGIPLIRYAEKGGELALPVYEYLKSLTSEEAVL
ncbi:ankyrin repeat domain-containing protein [Psychrobacillus sp. NPDC093180]|uniref:ankyrin repeat domain-containing protein n=1 Tax=Psychrobacillus sp. NPDC093180 TaxID=3364489 RepID=UPI003810CA5F